MKKFNLDSFRSIRIPSEEEIISAWQGCIKRPVVSIICLAYNHEEYIEDAIRGFLIQKTEFPFEIIIHDDASTDSTKSIILRYSEKYKKLIKPIIQNENQYSKSPNSVISIAAMEASGDYMAFCEGDDFWIAEDKLKIQTEIIRNNQKCTIVVNKGLLLEKEKISKKPHCDHGNREIEFTPQDILNTTGQFAPTASYLVRSDIIKNLPSWFKTAPIGDVFIELISSSIGVGIYSPAITSIYRVNSTSSWSASHNNGDELKLRKLIGSMKLHIFKFEEELYGKPLNNAIKESSWACGLAKIQLRDYNFEEFRRAIEESYGRLGSINKYLAILYYLRRQPKVLRFLLKAKGHMQ